MDSKENQYGILEAEIVEDKNVEIRHVGKILYFEGEDPIVLCGNGLVKLTKIVNSMGDEIVIKKFRTRFV